MFMFSLLIDYGKFIKCRNLRSLQNFIEILNVFKMPRLAEYQEKMIHGKDSLEK